MDFIRVPFGYVLEFFYGFLNNYGLALILFSFVVKLILLPFSAKLGHAVERNRMRRRLREVYRLHEAELLPGYDIVIVARSRAMEADFAELTRAFLTLAGRTGLMQEAAQ